MSPNIIRWVKLNSNVFETLETKLPNVMYLLEDTRELYNGNTNLTSDLYFVDALPSNPIRNKFYVTNNMQCRLWTGTEWKTIIPQIMGSLQDGVDSPGLVTGNAIKSYVTKKIELASGGIGPGDSESILTSDSVTLAKNLTVEGQELGNYKTGDVILKGTSLTTIFQNIFCKLIPPTYAMPTLSVRPGTQAYEIGSLINPIISSVYTARDGGEVSSYLLTKTTNGITNTLVRDVNITNYQMSYISLDNPIEITATVEYTAGPIKLDNLGNPYPDGRIMDGTLTSTMYLLPKRNMFYGALKTSIECNNDSIRNLPYNYLDPKQGDKLILPIEEGTSQIVIAIPKPLTISSVTSQTLNMNVSNIFTVDTLDIGGVNNTLPTPYNVYVYKPAIPFANNDTYTIVL